MNENQKLVLRYLEFKKQTPLYFENLPKEDIAKFKKYSLDTLVFRCLEKMKRYDSFCNEDKIFETRSGKWRSILDIWRHVLFFRPQTTIFDVMDSVARNEHKYYGQYCFEIHRRTFKTYVTGNWGISDKNLRDEFDLYFEDWQNINKE
jgi:hypothetical protein